MTPEQIQAAAEEQLAEQTRLAQEHAREAQKATENAKYARDCLTASALAGTR
ncbi:hypothetical protein [Streptomyces niveus]|uniref:hypothetical protein n=1 Tax=Streptomyces niveus TaxID=193462 RepID=UPI00342C4A46